MAFLEYPTNDPDEIARRKTEARILVAALKCFLFGAIVGFLFRCSW